MKSKILVFIIVFITLFIASLIIAIYNFDVLNSLVPEWNNVTHSTGKFIFVTLVSLVIISLVVTILIDWIKKILK